MEYFILTNNPAVRDDFEKIYFIDESVKKIFIRVRNLIHNRKMEAIKIGNEFRIFKEDYERFVKRNSTNF